MSSSAQADYAALTVLGTVTARAVASVDPTHSTPDNDAIVVDAEGVEDVEDLVDYNEVEEEAACEHEAKRKALREQIAATGLVMR